MPQTLQVRKTDLQQTRWATQGASPLMPGQVRARVDAFALTANNITYAAFGDAMNYWQFFPTGDADWGTVPVWGFGVVVESAHRQVPVGERLYGYWPMADEVVLQPDRVTPRAWVDALPHRAGLHAVYNQYTRCPTDPFYTAQTEAEQALLRPLFMTSWLIDDFLADNQFFGATTLLLTSASSKTAYGTAHLLAQRSGVQVVGLTSAGNVEFCKSLGCYHRVLTYEELSQVPADAAVVLVDFAGNANLRRDIHTRFAQLKYSCSIGGTHVSELGGARNLPGPPATLFFAPAQIKKRSAEWGGDELGRRMLLGWQGFLAKVQGTGAQPWLQVRWHRGAPAVKAAYDAVLSGRGDAREGHMLSLA
jgi:hypothetical protein